MSMMFYVQDDLHLIRRQAWGRLFGTCIEKTREAARPFCRGSSPPGRDGGIAMGSHRGRLRSRSSAAASDGRRP